MNIVNARLDMQLYVDCPYCKENFDLFDIPFLNDEGCLWKAARSLTGEDLNIDFFCPFCSEDLNLDRLEY